jgi:hypothetical protein
VGDEATWRWGDLATRKFLEGLQNLVGISKKNVPRGTLSKNPDIVWTIAMFFPQI